MSKYLQYYKDIFEGKPFLRDGKEITINEKSVFDGGGIQLIYDELEYELDKRGSGTVLDFGSGTGVHWTKKVRIPGQRELQTASEFLDQDYEDFIDMILLTQNIV